MKVMEVRPDDHMLFFFCIDYTVWPGKNFNANIEKLKAFSVSVFIL